MVKPQSAAAMIALVVLLSGQYAAASSLSFSIRDGRVTVIAKDVTVKEILVEWERIGRTTITNLDKLKGPRVTLELHEVPEAAALAVLLRSVSGYVVLPRTAPIAPGSVFQSILILPSSSSPAPPMPVTARAPLPAAPVTPAHVPAPATSTRDWPLPQAAGNPVALTEGRGASGDTGSASSQRFVPLSPAELAGARLTRQKQQDVLFRNNSTTPASGVPPVSTDASRPGTVTTVAPQPHQPPAARGR